MTSAALTVNKEWNTKLVSTENGEVAEKIVEESHNLWNSEYALLYEDFYEVYKERYNIIKHQREIAKSEEIPSLEKYRLKPNSMQQGFIANLRKILEGGEERELLISATGTHVILMTGRKALIYKEFGPVFFNIMNDKGILDNKKESHRVAPPVQSENIHLNQCL